MEFIEVTNYYCIIQCHCLKSHVAKDLCHFQVTFCTQSIEIYLEVYLLLEW